ncbi:hypothetical protein LTR70_006224 [Exophiala xenobiotica]|nr:hypothetical protein LTR70_006224 [Exophiala xenobiotica]
MPTASQKRKTPDNLQPLNSADKQSHDGHEIASPSRPTPKPRRNATLYDAVAGRIGPNGFLAASTLKTKTVTPSAPEEVLLRRVNAPAQIPYDYYNADEKLKPAQKLPDSHLVKDIHMSLDETALLAMGILLEEACKEPLGASGDMVLAEPQSWDRQLPVTMESQRQIVGMVVPERVQEHESSSTDEEVLERRPKRRRYRHQSPDG